MGALLRWRHGRGHITACVGVRVGGVDGTSVGGGDGGVVVGTTNGPQTGRVPTPLKPLGGLGQKEI